MSSPDKVFLHDRIKEISYDTGAGNFRLDGAIKGFAPFSNFYASGDAVFYAITDGTDWEVGSGQYIFDGSSKAIRRFAFNSSNGDNNVNFQAGVKEVFVSYPGKFSIFSANGMSTFNEPAASGLAFFASPHIVDYSSNLIWNTANNKLGITKSDPEYSIDVGGALSYSSARVSGVIVGESGIMFSGVSSSYASSYSGGRQLEPFMRNELDPTTGSNAIFSLSGLVDQRILLDTQVKGSVFAGPVSGCGAGDCSPDYPTFRYLTLEDIPDLSTLYTQQHNASYSGDIAFYRDSGVIEYDHYLNWDKTNNYLGVNRCDPQFTLDVDGNTSISGELDVQEETFLHNNLNVSGNVVISGNLDVQGNLTYIDSSTVTIWDKQLELASMSGTALANDSAIDDGGLVIKSSDSDKKWTWRDADDAWRTEQNVGISGTLKASGNSIFGNNLLITNALTGSGAAEFHDTVKTSGDATFYQDVLVNEDLKVSGTLNISGATIIDNTVNIYDNAYLHDNTFLKSNATISGNLDVSGVSFLNNALKTSGNVIFGQDLLVTNNMTTSGNAGISGNLDVNRDLFIYGSTYYDQDVTISGTLGVSGNATFDNNVIVKGDTYTAGNATTSGTLNASGNSTFDGNISAQKKLFVTEDSYFVGAATTSGNFNVSGVSTFNNDAYFTSLAPVVASGTVGISGATTLDGNLIAQKKLFVTEDSYFVGATTTSGNLNVSGVSIFNEDAYFTANAPVVMSGTLGVSGAAQFDSTINASGAASFGTTVTASGNIRSYSGVIGEWLNIQGDNSLNYMNGGYFFRQTTSDPFNLRINGNGIVPYTHGSAYNGLEGRAFSESSAAQVNAVSGLNTAQAFVYSTYASGSHYQRLAISGARYGDFEVSTQAAGSGVLRGINFNANTTFSSGVMFNDGIDFVGDHVRIGRQAGSGFENPMDDITIGRSAGKAAKGNRSIAIGYAAALESSGQRTIFIGDEAGKYADLATSVIGIGFKSNYQSSGNTSSVNIGYQSALGSSGTSNSVFIGQDAGQHAWHAANSVAIGRRTLAFSEEAQFVTAMGYLAASGTSGCKDAIMLGYGAGTNASGLEQSVLIGKDAGQNSYTFNKSVAVGWQAGYGAKDSDYSTFLGPFAGGYAGAISGLNHTLAVGSGAGYYAQGKHNVMVGGDCGAWSSGVDNIYIGVRAGFHTSGNHNLEISTCCDTLLPSGTIVSNKLNLSETIVGDISAKRLSIGDVNATHLSPNATLEIVPKTTDVALLASGDVNVSGLATLHGGLALKETTTPTALADHGKIYTKADNKLYFQDGAGTEHEIAFA